MQLLREKGRKGEIMRESRMRDRKNQRGGGETRKGSDGERERLGQNKRERMLLSLVHSPNGCAGPQPGARSFLQDS